MTHDERIEAMARAINAEFYGQAWDKTTVFRQGLCFDMALAALAAAGVEEMVREAAIEAWQSCGYNASEYYKGGFDPAAIAIIVREVMGK